jgi:hypothetical protein
VQNRQLFKNWMTALGSRFDKPLDEFASLAYFEAFADLTDDEFGHAARRVFQTHRYNTWPAPEVFIEVARGCSAEGTAALAWNVVEERFRYRNTGATYHDVCGTITEAMGGSTVAVTCLRLLGGDAAMRERTEWTRKEFIRLWPDAVRLDGQVPGYLPGWITQQITARKSGGLLPAPPALALPASPTFGDVDAPQRDGSGGFASFKAAREALRPTATPIADVLRASAQPNDEGGTS